MSTEQQSFDRFLEAFELALSRAGRKRSEVCLLPVSKGQDLAKIQRFLALEGFPQRLAENYLGEMAEKQKVLPQIEWHYQGALQSRKIPEILRHANVIQSVSRLKEVELLLKAEKSPKFFLQVNISDEDQKLGASEAEICEMHELLAKKGSSSCIGFMGVASELGDAIDEAHVRRQFAGLRKLRDKLMPRGKLSMGMSSDYALALMEGADFVRIGSALFGERLYSKA